MAEYSIIKIEYPHELNGEQEDILIRFFQLTRDEVKQKLITLKKMTKNPLYRWAGGITANNIRNLVQYSLDNFETMFILEKEDQNPKIYSIKIQSANLDFLSNIPGKIDPRNMTAKLFDNIEVEIRKEVCRRQKIPMETVKFARFYNDS